MFSGIPFTELEFRCIYFPWNKFHSGKTAPFVIITLLTVVVLAAQIIFIPDISDADEVWTLKSHFIAKCSRLSRIILNRRKAILRRWSAARSPSCGLAATGRSSSSPGPSGCMQCIRRSLDL